MSPKSIAPETDIRYDSNKKSGAVRLNFFPRERVNHVNMNVTHERCMNTTVLYPDLVHIYRYTL